MANYKIGVDFTANLGNLTQAAGQGAAALKGVGDAAANSAKGINGMGGASDRASAGLGNLSRDAAAAATSVNGIGDAASRAATGMNALGSGATFDNIKSSAIQAIIPINTLEAKMIEVREEAAKIGTVQGAAQLAVRYEILNRTLTETRDKINEASRAAIGLSNAFNVAATAGANRLAPATKLVLTDLKLMPIAATQAAAGLNKFKGAAGASNAVLTDFSRVIQDAPFGLVGIGNNLTQLPEAFNRLSAAAKESGKSVGSLLLSSVTGIGGIGLALSLVTTALTFASVGFSAWTRGFGDNKKKTDEAKKSLEDFLETLTTVDDVAGSAAAGVQGQIAQVQALGRVVTDASKSYDVRKRALEELSQVNKKYFGELKVEDAATGAVTAKVNEYTKALVANAVVKGFTDEITRLSTELFKQEKATESARTKMRQLEDQFAKTKKVETSLTGEERVSQKYIALGDAVANARKEFEAQRKAEEDIATNRATFAGALQKANEEALKFADISDNNAKKTKKETDALKERIDFLEKLGRTTAQDIELADLKIKLILRDEKGSKKEIQNLIDNVIEEAFPQREVDIELKTKIKINRDREEPGSIADAVLPSGVIPDGAFDGVIEAADKKSKEAATRLKELLRENFLMNSAEGIQQGLIDSVDLVGQSLGDIFSGERIGDALSNAASGFLGIIGGVLQEVGKQIVLTSTLVGVLFEALDKLFKPGGWLLSLGAGLGLIALGGILKNIKIPAFADGVTNFAGGMALVGERGPELVRLPTGSDVIPNNQLGRFAGGESNIVGTSIVRGNDLWIVMRRESNRKRRI